MRSVSRIWREEGADEDDYDHTKLMVWGVAWAADPRDWYRRLVQEFGKVG